MSTSSLSPLQKIISRLAGVKPVGSRYYTALCPLHGDREASLQISERADGSVGVHCHAGCTPKGDPRRLDAFLQSLDLSYADLFPGGVEKKKPDQENLTIIDLCEEKIIDWKMLINWFGLEEVQYQGRTVLKIPYYDENKIEHPRYRRRLSLRAGQRFNWGGEAGIPPIAYGIHLLDKAKIKKYLVLVEGESDVWTLYQHGIPAVGLPGASQADKLQAEHLLDIEQVYILDEGGNGGPTFIKGISRRLEEIGYEGGVRVAQIYKSYKQCKDPNDLNILLHREGRLTDFSAEFSDILSASVLLQDWSEPGDDLAPRLVSIDFVLNFPPVRWLVGGMLPEGGLAMLLAQENTGKSFLAIDWACSVATGIDWLHRPVNQGKVVYAAAEGLQGHSKRLKAWLLQKGYEHLDALKSNLFYVAGTIDLFDQERRVQFVDMSISAQPALVIIDTLAESMPGADENTSRDMGMFISVARQIRQETGACVLVLHHMPKSGNGSRGHSSLPGALDMRFELIVPDESDRTFIELHTTKTRDVIRPKEPILLKLHQVMLSDVEYDNSAVLLPGDRILEDSDHNSLTVQERKIYDVLQNMGRLSSKELMMQADNLGIKRAMFHKLLKSLYEKDYIRKISDENDKRSLHYEVL
jgi:DNA-binding MarR family transcriptional regulator